MEAMTTRSSAGILLFHEDGHGQLEVLLVHPGGPFWATKDDAAWSIPKGEYGSDEDPLVAAEREFGEETGFRLPDAERLSLGVIRQSGGKSVLAWAVRGDADAARATSNTFEMEWPRHSGQMRTFPEVDRVEWFTLEVAKKKLLEAQAPLLDRLLEAVSTPDS